MSAAVTIDQGNFDTEVIQSDTPVLVDFWAEWCMPCKMVAPVLEQLSQDYAGRLKIAKVDVDDNGEIAQKFNIVSIPTLLLFKGGSVVGQQVGAVPRETIEGLFKDYL
ncbi:MAG: thioredoxin [Spirochaetaceae bacterium]|nr:thioredoxin [Spirochaetaceae bacterium]MDE0229918.1 thioredoxin [Spirochaetaceae bacterium]MDE0445128.1 thioredoxin [Spirochaetaceae bacterium]